MAFVGAFVSFIMSVPAEHSGLGTSPFSLSPFPPFLPPSTAFLLPPLNPCDSLLTFPSSFFPLFSHLPPVGGVWNSVLQLGAAALLSITATIQVSAGNDRIPGVKAPTREGYRYGYIFAMALLIAEAVLVLIFFKDPLQLQKSGTEETVQGEEEKKEEKEGVVA